VEYEKEFALELERNPFSQPVETDDSSAAGLVKGRID
jgi:hypothetical protein